MKKIIVCLIFSIISLISINAENIYGYTTNCMVWVNISDLHINSSGHVQYTTEATDKNRSRCRMRFVFREDIEAPLQIYIYYSNIQYVYNVIVTQSGPSNYYGI